jgi:hypothetical protein
MGSQVPATFPYPKPDVSSQHAKVSFLEVPFQRNSLICYLVFTFFKAYRFLYVPPGMWCSLCAECFVRISEQTATLALYIIN